MTAGAAEHPSHIVRREAGVGLQPQSDDPRHHRRSHRRAAVGPPGIGATVELRKTGERGWRRLHPAAVRRHDVGARRQHIWFDAPVEGRSGRRIVGPRTVAITLISNLLRDVVAELVDKPPPVRISSHADDRRSRTGRVDIVATLNGTLAPVGIDITRRREEFDVRRSAYHIKRDRLIEAQSHINRVGRSLADRFFLHRAESPLEHTVAIVVTRRIGRYLNEIGDVGKPQRINQHRVGQS